MTTDGNEMGGITPSSDPNELVMSVFRESYLQTTEDLRHYAEKIKYFNQQKKAVRDAG